jgi:hypothetical protein
MNVYNYYWVNGSKPMCSKVSRFSSWRDMGFFLGGPGTGWVESSRPHPQRGMGDTYTGVIIPGSENLALVKYAKILKIVIYI